MNADREKRALQRLGELEEANKALREIKSRFEAVYNHHFQLTGLLDVDGRLPWQTEPRWSSPACKSGT
jgi:hypothetical protein